MVAYLGTECVPVEEDFFAGSAVEVAPRLIGCVLHHDDRGKDTAIMISETEAYGVDDQAAQCHPSASAQRRNGSGSMLLAGGHVHNFQDRGMPCLDLVCDQEGPRKCCPDSCRRPRRRTRRHG
jgi:DNA-3-methyladenine glycosylase